MKISAFEQRATFYSLRSFARFARFIAAAMLATTLVTAPRALSQPIDDATRNAARELAAQAADAFAKGEYDRALDFYRRAYALIPAPTLALREARSLEKLGRWVEAVEAYVRATRSTLAPDAPEPYRQAVREASEELARLRPRVPRLKVVLRGGEPTEMTVRLDGKPIKPALVGVEQPVNPGEHAIDATGAGKRGEARIALAEGETKTIEIELAIDPDAKPTPAAAVGESSRREPGAAAEQPAAFPQRTLGFVAIGVGAAGLGVGVVTGVMATSKHSSAEDGCPDGKCPEGSQAAEDMESFRSLRTISTIGYAVAIVGAAAGITLVLTAPDRTDTARVAPFVGIGSAGVAGRF